MRITDDVIYVGVNDRSIDIFEGQYKVSNGVTYNSYLIRDEKNLLLDTVDARGVDEWIKNIEMALNGESVDYLVISHMEPDHSAGIKALADKYPEMKIVSNQKAFAFLPQFFDISNLEERKIVVNEGDSLNVGRHILRFIMAAMVHWPEVMMEYEENEKILFSADAFGTFGIVSEYECNAQEILKNEEFNNTEKENSWLKEARRYYLNIVGKYGIKVQSVLKKASSLEISKICPLHGPILTENLGYYIDKYDTWSSYKWEDEGILIACASMHGYTLEAMKKFQEMLQENSSKEVELIDLTRDDMTYAVAEAFKYKNLVLASPTYNAELFPAMDSFLRLLKSKGFQNRSVALVENGTWAPMANKLMVEVLAQMKNIEIIEPCVTIRTKIDEELKGKLRELVNVLNNM